MTMNAAALLFDALVEAHLEPFLSFDPQSNRAEALGTVPEIVFNEAFDIDEEAELTEREVALLEIRGRAVEAAERGDRAALDAAIREAEVRAGASARKLPSWLRKRRLAGRHP
jgi:hypothetical protein